MKKILSLLLIISLIGIFTGCGYVNTGTNPSVNANYYQPYTERYKDINSGATMALSPETRTFETEIPGVPNGKKTGKYQEQGNKIVLDVDGDSYEQYVFTKEGNSLSFDAYNSHGMGSSALDYSRFYKQ